MRKFSKNANLILWCLGINNITSIFIYTYLLAFIINISNDNIVNVALFYLSLHISMIIFSWFMAPVFKKIKSTTSLKLGILSKFLFVCLVVVFYGKIISFVILIAVCNAFSEVVFWIGANSLQSKLGQNNDLTHFMSASKALNTIISLVVPLIMGYLIDTSGLFVIAIAMIFCVIIQIVLSVFIKDDYICDTNKLKIKEFWSFVTRENLNTKKIYFNQFLFGICSTISMLILYYTVTIFGTNLSIGIFSSVSAILALSLLGLFNWRKKLFTNKIFAIISSILIISSICLLLINFNKLSLILFYSSWNILIIIPETITSTLRLEVIKKKNLANYNIENVTISETFLDTGRIVGELTILIMAMVNNNIFNIVCLLLIAMNVPIYLIHTSAFNKK